MTSVAKTYPHLLQSAGFWVTFWLLITTGVAEADGLKFLEQLEEGLVTLAEEVRPTVVNISPYVPPSPTVGSMDNLRKGRPTNAGAGVIFDGEKGLVVTNHHVVRNAQKVQVTLLGGEELIGKVLGVDEDTDIALLQVQADRPLPQARFGDSSKVRIGQLVVAVGNPYGLNDTLTLGIVSGLNRENINLSRYEDFIQTDASINPGNSGGPLLNVRGEVVGINTAIINYAQSIGFAIPSNMVRNTVTQLIEYGEVRRGWLGVGIEPVTRKIAREARVKEGVGVWVNSVFKGDPAHQAGIRVGDVILKVGGTPVNSPNRVIRLIGSISPGQTVTLDIIRGGQRKVIPVTLQGQKKDRQAALATPPALTIPLGIEVDSSDKEKGARIANVIPGSPAQREGIRVGDRILALNGLDVSSGSDFEKRIEKIRPGDKAFLLVLRDEEKMHLVLVREE